jgi:mitogen-activated protein kinase 1/3
VDERYECIKQIGHGAYGVVCSGQDNLKNKKIAIKKVPPPFDVDPKRI